MIYGLLITVVLLTYFPRAQLYTQLLQTKCDQLYSFRRTSYNDRA